MSYDGQAWSKPRMLADSDNILDNRPALVPFGSDGVLAVYSSDWRLRGASNLVRAGRLPLKADLYATLLRGGGPVVAAATGDAVGRIDRRSSRSIPTSRKTSSGCASSAWSAGGKTYQLARGEFHRHTEYTAHRDGDGSLEDMWRYAQDAADMDWLGNADHDNGFGQQYAWWTIQKTMDIYHNPPWFIAPFTYERSVNWPNGHRNVIFAQPRHPHACPAATCRATRRPARPTPRCSMPT